MSCGVAVFRGDIFWGHLDPSPKYWALDRSYLLVWLETLVSGWWASGETEAWLCS